MSAAALAGLPLPSLLEALAAVPDARQRRGRRYAQASLLTLAVCAMLCGARSLDAIAQWGHAREGGALAAASGFEWGRSPSVATLFRTFRDLDVDAFEQALANWLGQDAPPSEVLAIDGKTLRGIHGEHVPGVHLVAAFAHGRGAVRAEKGAPAASMN